MSRGWERAYDQMEGRRERPEWFYVVAMIALMGPVYAPWIIAAARWGWSLVR